MKKIAVALLATCAFAGAAHAGNLVSNGSFESGFAGWTFSGNQGNEAPHIITYGDGSITYGEPILAPNVASSSPDPIGTHGAYFVGDDAAQMMTQAVSFTAGTTYTGGFDLYVPVNGSQNSGFGTLSVSIANFTLLTVDAAATTPGSWLHYETTGSLPFDFTAPLTFTYNSGAKPAKDFVIDRVFITDGAVPEPASWAMMIAGFGLVGSAMRRRSAIVAAA